MNGQVNISSKQVIMYLFLNKKSNCIDITEIFLLQDFINRKNDENIHMDISFEDIKRTVQYNDELFVMAGYRILLREGKENCIDNHDKLPRKVSKYIEDYIKEPSLFRV
jgi:hypothetical protein